MENLKKAYLAGGCFWGMEDLFRVRPGVKDTEPVLGSISFERIFMKVDFPAPLAPIIP